FFEWHVEPLQNGFLGQARCYESVLRDLQRKGSSLVEVGLYWNVPVDESVFFHLSRGHRLTGQNHFHGPVLSDGSSETLSPACSRHDSYVDLWLGESCGLGCDDDVAVHGQFAATAVDVAADCSYDGLRDLFQAVPEGELVLLDQRNRSCLR